MTYHSAIPLTSVIKKKMTNISKWGYECSVDINLGIALQKNSVNCRTVDLLIPVARDYMVKVLNSITETLIVSFNVCPCCRFLCGAPRFQIRLLALKY